MDKSTSVLIVGAGPVGLCLALDLAWRGIDVTVVEERQPIGSISAKCNHVSSRTMETFRRLGIAAEVRDAGLPGDYPHDVVFRTSGTGYEIGRLKIPCRNERFGATEGIDTDWPTPEPPHRVNQIFFEPILLRHALENPRITIHDGTRFEEFREEEDGVSVALRSSVTGETFEIRAQFLVGCDGGRSSVRRAMGASLHGDEVIQKVQSTFFRAPDLLQRLTPGPAWMSYLYTPERAGNLIAVDGQETWLLHNYLLPGEADFDVVDRDACLRLLLGVGADFSYEIIAREDWIGRRLVADRVRVGRAFICGDAAHLWVPYAGYGMNAGIADAMNISWLLGAHLGGWAPASILDAYEAERLPITDQVSRFAMSHAKGAIGERTSISPLIKEDSLAGEAERRRVGDAAAAFHQQQFACAGLNFGYFYTGSPIIAYDGEDAPAYSMGGYEPSTVPGCRVPHIWLADGRSLYDAMGRDYTLLRFDRNVDVTPMLRAAEACRVPLTLLDIDVDTVPPPYRH
ncbi:MAG: FAD-dependent oxidoreductase, partial [Novosphingobium sp.]